MVRHGVLKEGHMPPFRGRPWEEIRDWYAELGWTEVEPLVAVVDSVLQCGGAERLVATTSMHDLWVARRVGGGAASAVDVIKVCSASSMRAVRHGEILVVHTSHSGQEEELSRPTSEAVPLFWRFVSEKWGIEPWRWQGFTEAEHHVLMLASEGADLYETTWPSTIVEVGGSRAMVGLEFGHAQQVVAELLRVGLVQVIVMVGPDEHVAHDDDLVQVFGSEAAWRRPGSRLRARLTLSPAANKWYYRRGSAL